MAATFNYLWNITLLKTLIGSPIIFINQDLSPPKGILSIDLISSLDNFEDVGSSDFTISKTA